MHPRIATLGTNQRCREKISEVYEWFVERIKECGGSYRTPVLSEISGFVGISANTLGKYLRTLVGLGLLVVSNPDYKKWRYARYSLPEGDAVEADSITEEEEPQVEQEAPPEQQDEEFKAEVVPEDAPKGTPFDTPAIEDDSVVPYIKANSIIVRNERVLLDFDLARVYGVETRALNQQRERNPERFPEDFAFQLKDDEMTNLQSQNVTAISSKTRYNPWAYTLEGCNMASAVLNTEKAIKRSVQIHRTFSDLERTAHGEEPKQPGFAEMLTAVASGFGVLRGELDTKVSIPVFEGEKQRLLAGIEELAGKVHQTTVRDDNFQKDLEGYRIKLDNTITRLMEEKVERLKMQDERRRQAELRRLYQYGQIYGAMIGNKVTGGGCHAVWKKYIEIFGYSYKNTPLEVIPERIERMKNNIIAYAKEHQESYHNLRDSDKIFLAFEGVMDFQQLQIRF